MVMLIVVVRVEGEVLCSMVMSDGHFNADAEAGAGAGAA